MASYNMLWTRASRKDKCAWPFQARAISVVGEALLVHVRSGSLHHARRCCVICHFRVSPCEFRVFLSAPCAKLLVILVRGLFLLHPGDPIWFIDQTLNARDLMHDGGMTLWIASLQQIQGQRQSLL